MTEIHEDPLPWTSRYKELITRDLPFTAASSASYLVPSYPIPDRGSY